MKKLIWIIPAFLILLGACKEKNKSQNNAPTEQLKKLESENDHLREFIAVNAQENFITMPTVQNAYAVSDTSEKNPLQIFGKINKKNLVIRYTSVGCNACSDIFFKELNKATEILKQYDILVLADYSDYIYFLKWYKIAEVNQKVLRLKRGGLPLSLEKENNSYVFVIDTDKKVSSIFIPRSLFPELISLYFKGLI